MILAPPIEDRAEKTIEVPRRQLIARVAEGSVVTATPAYTSEIHNPFWERIARARPLDGRPRSPGLCRYAARPAIATERVHELPDGGIANDLRHTWSDGTTRVVFEPLAFLEQQSGAARGDRRQASGPGRSPADPVDPDDSAAGARSAQRSLADDERALEARSRVEARITSGATAE